MEEQGSQFKKTENLKAHVGQTASIVGETAIGRDAAPHGRGVLDHGDDNALPVINLDRGADLSHL